MPRGALCRSRRELSNAYLLAKFSFDTAENEPCQVCPIECSERLHPARPSRELPRILQRYRGGPSSVPGGVEAEFRLRVQVPSSWPKQGSCENDRNANAKMDRTRPKGDFEIRVIKINAKGTCKEKSHFKIVFVQFAR